MALSKEEQARLDILEAKFGGAGKQESQSSLTPEEAARLKELEAKFGPQSASDIIGSQQTSSTQLPEIVTEPYSGNYKPVTGRQVEAATQAFGDPIGVLPQMQAGLSRAVNYISPQNKPFTYGGQEFIPQEIPSNYQSELQDFAAYRDRLRNEEPEAYSRGKLAGQVTAGAIMPPIFKAPQTAGPILKGVVGGLSNLAEYAGINTIGNLAEQQQRGEEINVPQAVQQGFEGGSIPAGIGAAIPMAGPLANSAYKKIINTVLGVPEDVVENYVARSEEINAAPTRAEISDKAKKIVEGAYEKGGAQLEEFNELKGYIKGTEDNLTRTLSDSAKDIVKQAKEADDTFKAAVTDRLEKLKMTANPSKLANDVMDSTSKLKQQVIEGSEKSYEELANPGSTSNIPSIKGKKYDTTINIPTLIKKIREATESGLSETPSGLKSYSDSSQAALDKAKDKVRILSRMMVDFNSKDIPATTLKEFIQGLDQDIKIAINKNDFTDAVDGVSAKIRSIVNGELRKIGNYGKIMDEVSEKTRLLADLNKRFSNVDEVTTALKGSVGKDKVLARQSLNKLGELTGKDFNKQLSRSEMAQNILSKKSVVERMKSNLPEAKTAKDLKVKLAKVKDPYYTKDIIAKATNKDRVILGKMEQELEKFKIIKSNLGPNRSSSVNVKVKGTMLDPTKNKEFFRQLAELSDESFEQTLKDARIKEIFQKGFPAGSRNVNLFKTIGEAVGFRGASAIFALAGATVDKYGPRIAKVIIDSGIKLGKNPTTSKIMGLNVSKEVKDILINEFRNMGKFNDD